MPIIEVEPLNTRRIKDSILNVNQYLQDTYFTKVLHPGDFTENSSNVSLISTDSRWSCILFVNSVTNESAYATFKPPTFWVNGYFSIEVLYAVEDTNSINLRIGLYGVSTGGDLTSGATTVASIAETVSSGTAGILGTVISEETTNPILGTYDILGLQLTRLSTSTSTADFKILQAKIRYHAINPQ
jgi:hypothetical protein